MTRMPARVRRDAGFGLVELLIALLVLNVGLLSIMAAFTNGIINTRHASRAATASALAESQIELYRALTYPAIALDPSSIPSSAPYTSDAAYNASQVTATCSGQVSDNPQCNASQAVTGPDAGAYQVDTYIVWFTPTNGRQLKQVTVVVRDARNLLGPELVRRSTLFDESTGT